MNHKTSGILFIAAGIASFVAAATAKELSLYGVGFVFIGIGIAFLRGKKE